MLPGSARLCEPVARRLSAISKLKSKNTRPSCAKTTNGGASALSPAPKLSLEFLRVASAGKGLSDTLKNSRESFGAGARALAPPFVVFEQLGLVFLYLSFVIV